MRVSRQIGWSNKSNLLYEILRELNALKGQFAVPTTTTTTTPALPNLTVKIDNNPNFDINAVVPGIPADFTIEFYANFIDDNGHPRPWSIGSWPSAAHGLSIEGGGNFYYWINGSIVFNTSITGFIGTWTHFCIMRKDNDIYFFQNGIVIGTLNYTGAIPTNGYPLYLGSEGNDSVMNGNLSDFRWNNDFAVYPTTGFSPPTNPLTDIPGSKLLIFQGTDLASELSDLTGNGYTITNASGIYSADNPYSGTQGSILFGHTVGFTFRVDNTLGNAGDMTGALYQGYTAYDAYVDWGDGSPLEYYVSNTDQFFIHSYTSNSIFNVTVYLADPTNINTIQNNLDKGNYHLLQVDNSKLTSLLTCELYNNKLSSSQVNKILSELVANGLNAGALFLQQEVPAPPTGQGLIDKATLISRSWTVVTD